VKMIDAYGSSGSGGTNHVITAYNGKFGVIVKADASIVPKAERSRKAKYLWVERETGIQAPNNRSADREKTGGREKAILK